MTEPQSSASLYVPTSMVPARQVNPSPHRITPNPLITLDNIAVRFLPTISRFHRTIELSKEKPMCPIHHKSVITKS
jgi:hypothetical protein